MAGTDDAGAVGGVTDGLASIAGTEGSGSGGAMREVGGCSTGVGAAVVAAGLRGGVVVEGVVAGLASNAGTVGSGGGGLMREVGGCSAGAGAAVVAAGLAGGVEGGVEVVRAGGCSGGVDRSVSASFCEADGVRDSVTGGARGFFSSGERGGAPGAGVFVSARFSIGGRVGGTSGEVTCGERTAGTEPVARVGSCVDARGGIVSGFDAEGSGNGVVAGAPAEAAGGSTRAGTEPVGGFALAGGGVSRETDGSPTVGCNCAVRLSGM